jgi:hypothetical protein
MSRAGVYVNRFLACRYAPQVHDAGGEGRGRGGAYQEQGGKDVAAGAWASWTGRAGRSSFSLHLPCWPFSAAAAALPHIHLSAALVEQVQRASTSLLLITAEGTQHDCE